MEEDTGNDVDIISKERRERRWGDFDTVACFTRE